MSKGFSYILAATLVAALMTGCGNSDSNGNSIDNSNTNTNVVNEDDGGSSSTHVSNEYTEYGQGNFNENELSEHYIIGIGGFPSYGDTYECMGYRLIVTSDKELIYYIGSEEAGRKIIDDEIYNELISQIDYKAIATVEVYHPDPYDICDGGDNYIYLYDKNDEAYIARGGFCVGGDKFWSYYRLVSDLSDYEWENECLEKYKEKVENMQENNKIFLLNAIPDLKYEDLFVERLMCEAYGCGLIESISVPVIIDGESVSFIITDEHGKKFDVTMYYTDIHNSIFEHSIAITDEEREVATEPVTYEMLVSMWNNMN